MATPKEKIQKRRDRAKARYKLYTSLSSSEKLELIRSRRGESKKETEKVLKQIKEIDNNDKNI